MYVFGALNKHSIYLGNVMPNWLSKKILYIVGSIALGILGLVGTVEINLNVGGAIEHPKHVADPPFQRSGRTSHDVMQALVALNRLNAISEDPRVASVTNAIEAAEREFGLPIDGIADRSLLGHLMTKLHSERTDLVSHESSTNDTNSLWPSIGAAFGAFLSELLSSHDDANRDDKKS